MIFTLLFDHSWSNRWKSSSQGLRLFIYRSILSFAILVRSFDEEEI